MTTKVVSEKALGVVEEIIARLIMNPQEEITGYIGCGSHARKLNSNGKAPHCHDGEKIVIAGDSYDMAKNELYYLLWDLAVEVGISDEKRELLREIS